MNYKYFLVSTLLVHSFLTQAQISVPVKSPLCTISQRVGISEVKVEYSRPSARGRKIFGDVVPYNQIWRTGANAPAKITFGDSVIIGGAKIAGGTYALYTIPTEKEWTIVLGKNPNVYAASHKAEDDAVRFTVLANSLNDFVETFTIDVNNTNGFKADVVLSWEKTSVKFPVDFDADAKLTRDIKNKLESVDMYWQAANYYYDTNKDMKMALEWVNKVVEKNPRYWTWHLKAKIHARLNDKKGATEAAKKSIELAKADKSDEYVKLNEKLLSELK